MNPTSSDPTAPPPPPQPPRSSFSCDRHPNEQFTGFCPTCLCERLHTLDKSSSNTPSSSRRPSSASAAIKSLFSSKPTTNIIPPPPPPAQKSSKPTSFFPELRRTKSFSASKNEALSLIFEPQRKSCDVRVRNTLSTLFNLAPAPSSSSSHQNPQITKQIESFVPANPVFEEPEHEDDFKDPENVDNGADDSKSSEGDEIKSVPECNEDPVEFEVNSGEIVEEQPNNLKPMKDHIDIDAQEKKSSSGGGFWAAASVFSKKWHSWRNKQKMKKRNNGNNFAALPVEKPISRQYRETQSEIADYGFGRRSCDIDPRFSLDAGRISFDDPRYSFDEPRASWDGYLMGRNFPRMAPMVSVMEDAPAVHVPRSDMQIPVEEPPPVIINDGGGGEAVPGGSAQTRDYYLDSSSRRRKSLDRSSSIRRTAAAVVAEIDELKTVSNSKVSPATAAEYFHGSKVMVGERDDCSETFELSSGVRENGDRKESKKTRKWSWKLWGFIQRRYNGGNKEEEEDYKYSRGNSVDRAYSESWQDFRQEVSGNRNMFRSNSSVSWRHANQVGGSFGRSVNMNGKKKREEFVLEKNRSARFSPNHVDNGLLRLYLTPMSSGRRGGGGGGGGMGKIKPSNSHSIARSVLRLY